MWSGSINENVSDDNVKAVLSFLPFATMYSGMLKYICYMCVAMRNIKNIL